MKGVAIAAILRPWPNKFGNGKRGRVGMAERNTKIVAWKREVDAIQRKIDNGSSKEGRLLERMHQLQRKMGVPLMIPSARIRVA